MARITVVNDNPEFLELMKDVLGDERYETTTIDGARADTLDRIRASEPDLLVLDLRLSSDGLLGWQLAQEVREKPGFEGLPILVCSADVEALKQLEGQLEEGEVVALLPKPFSIDQLTGSVDRLLTRPHPG